jgi:hypothetical protein
MKFFTQIDCRITMAAGESEESSVSVGDVESAARAAGYSGPFWHGTNSEDFHVFDTSKSPAWTSSSEIFASGWGKNVFPVFVKIDNPKKYVDAGLHMADLDVNGTAKLKRRGHDGAIISNPSSPSLPTNYAVCNPSGIKLAARATYDDEGVLIPLEKRFDNSNPDIRY